MGIEPTHSF